MKRRHTRSMGIDTAREIKRNAEGEISHHEQNGHKFARADSFICNECAKPCLKGQSVPACEGFVRLDMESFKEWHKMVSPPNLLPLEEPNETSVNG